MPNNQDEMDKVLDDIESKLPDDEVIAADKEVVEEITEDKEPKEEAEKSPPGFMNYQEWIDAGKDPKKFRGEEAYSDHYESLQEIKGLKDSVSAIADGMTSWKETQRNQENERVADAITTAKANLAKAEEEDDVSAALQAEREITALNDKANSAEEVTHVPNPVLAEFQGKYPIIDQKSSQFDKDFYDDMAMMQGTILDKLTGGVVEKINALTPGQIQRSLDLAYREAKSLHPGKFTSKKNARKSSAPAPQKRQASEPDLTSKIRNFGSSRLNENDKNPAGDMYDLLMSLDPTGKRAKAFASKLVGDTK